MTASAPQAPTGTGRLTRVTLIGPRHRVDLVLPSDEPLGMLLPEIVTMVGYESSGDPRGYQLSKLDGQVLEPNSNLRRAGITDGTLLRVDQLTEAPPAPILHDVTDEVADDLGRRRGRWDATARCWTATAAVTGAAMLAATLATPVLAPVPLTAVGVTVLMIGAVLGAFVSQPVGNAVILGGAAVAMTSVPSWTVHLPARWALWVLGIAITMLALGLANRAHRAGAFGAGSLLLLLGVWSGMWIAGFTAHQTAAVMAIVSVGGLGVLPRLAMLASGLTALDDRQSNDAPVTRVAAEAVVDSAHRGLTLASVVTAMSGALAGWMLAQAATGWTIALACLLGAALMLRLRAFPLTVEVFSLVVASLAVGTGLVLRWMQARPDMWWGGAAAAVGVIAIGLVVLAFQPQPHVRARARQVADRLEGVAVVALVPVAVGVFDVYPRLLETF